MTPSGGAVSCRAYRERWFDSKGAKDSLKVTQHALKFLHESWPGPAEARTPRCPPSHCRSRPRRRLPPPARWQPWSPRRAARRRPAGARRPHSLRSGRRLRRLLGGRRRCWRPSTDLQGLSDREERRVAGDSPAPLPAWSAARGRGGGVGPGKLRPAERGGPRGSRSPTRAPWPEAAWQYF